MITSFNNRLERSVVPTNTNTMNDNIRVASTRSLFIFISVYVLGGETFLYFSGAAASSEEEEVGLRPFMMPYMPTLSVVMTAINFR